jgi:Na+/proline symporter
MTGSEWILTRFGNDRAGKASHIIVAVFAIISTIGFIAYFFEGIGKFLTVIYLDLAVDFNGGVFKFRTIICFNNYFLTTLYTIKGGMFSVATEVLQYGIMVLSGLLIQDIR